MNWMFSECTGLKSLPDLYKWDLKNLKSKDGMFHNCNLENLPKVQNIEIIENKFTTKKKDR